MARAVVDSWIPEEYGGAVITAIAQQSAVEALARPEPMSTDAKYVPRSGAMTFDGAIGKGVAYGEDGSTADNVLLTARKLGKVVRLADEDLKDGAVVNIIEAKQMEWARSHALGFDNACLGTSAVSNGTTVPFNSLYYALNTTNAATGYTADANLIQTAGDLTVDGINGAFEMVEDSSFWSDSDAVVIAHPAFKALLRDLETDGPVFDRVANTIYGAPVVWTAGAKVNATASAAPSGNPLLFVGNRQYLIKGDRSGPEYMLAPADSGAAFLTDEALLKMRIRRGFAVANENAWAAVELTPETP